jgi:hypothetical protein
MTRTEKPNPTKEDAPPQDSSAAALRVIEEYAASLREIIKKLRRSLE